MARSWCWSLCCWVRDSSRATQCNSRRIACVCRCVGYQHSPDVFHALLPHFTELLRRLSSERKRKREPDPASPAHAAPTNPPHDSPDAILPQPFPYASLLPSALGVDSATLAVLYSAEELPLAPTSSDGASSGSFELPLSALLHTLMQHHTGYPELYTPLLELLSEYVRCPLSLGTLALLADVYCSPLPQPWT